jgi:hypothetical protein
MSEDRAAAVATRRMSFIDDLLEPDRKAAFVARVAVRVDESAADRFGEVLDPHGHRGQPRIM